MNLNKFFIQEYFNNEGDENSIEAEVFSIVKDNEIGNSVSKRDYRVLQVNKIIKIGDVKRAIIFREDFIVPEKRQDKQFDDYSFYFRRERQFLRKIYEAAKTREKSEEIERAKLALCNQTVDVFRSAIKKFPDRLNLCYAFVSFGKEFGVTKDVSRIFKEMLEKHTDLSSDFWICAIMFEYEVMERTAVARKYTLDALNLNDDVCDYYFTYLKIELREGAKIQTANSEVGPDVQSSLNRTRLIFETAKKKFVKDLNFAIGFLYIVQDFNYTISLQEEIMKDLERNYPNSEFLYHIRAQRELKGYHRQPVDGVHNLEDYDDEYKIEMPGASARYPRKKKLRKRLELAVEIYDSAILLFKGTETMWNYYILAMEQLVEEFPEEIVYINEVLLRCLENADKTITLDEVKSMHYLDLLMLSKQRKKFDSVAQKMQNRFRYYTKFWDFLIGKYISIDDEEAVIKTFKESGTAMLHTSVSLWTLFLGYFEKKGDKSKIEEIYKQSCREKPSVADNFKPLYMKWKAEQCGVEEARRLYFQYISNQNASFKVHEAMVEIEIMQPKYDMRIIRSVYETYCSDLGNMMPRPWLNFMQFELTYGNPNRVERMYSSALQILDASGSAELKREYSLMMPAWNRANYLMQTS